MKRLFIIIFALAFTLPAVAQEQAENYIQVNGVAEKEVAPNEFYLSITLDESDTKGKQEIDAQRRSMIAALKNIGINTEKSLSVANMASSFYKRNTSLATAKYQLQLSSAEQVAKVYDALESLNISDIRIERVSHSDLEQFRSQVRKEAIQNAKQVATELAEAIGQSIGACFYIYDSNYGVGGTRFVGSSRVYKSTNSTAEEEEVVEFKKIKLSYSVNAKFRLND